MLPFAVFQSRKLLWLFRSLKVKYIGGKFSNCIFCIPTFFFSFFSSAKCFEFTWTEGSNRNETSNTCNTGDEIPCYDPQLSTAEPPTSEEIYNPEFQQGKICDKGAGSFCIKVSVSWLLSFQNVLQKYFVLLVHQDFHSRSFINYPCLTVLW